MSDNEVPPVAEPTNLSRRAFLRRAGSEATTTATMLPGAGLAARALGIAGEQSDNRKFGFAGDWWQRLIHRRERPAASPTEEPTKGGNGDV